MTLWLVGMMGSGKSAAGRRAAADLDVGFADTDEVVAGRADRSVAEVWRSEGEAGFRSRERRVVAHLSGFPGVVATGGGAVLDEGSRGVMRRGTVVWLRASPEQLARRVEGRSDRPLLEGTEPVAALATLLEQRGAVYAEVAHHQIDTEDLDIDEVARLIGELWRG